MLSLDYIVSPKTNGANPFLIFQSLSDFDSELLACRIKTMSYREFLKTAYWFGVSSKAKSNAGMRCQVCNSGQQLNVHHRTYDTHGYEHENMFDLVVLCGGCHGLFHGHREPDYTPSVVRSGKRKRQSKIVPHDESDIFIPENDVVIMTHDLLKRCRANGSFTNATLRALGIKQPLVAGWGQRLIGTVITKEKYIEAQRGRFIYASGPLDRQ